MNTDTFISYRRQASMHLARNIFTELNDRRGINAFLDVQNIDATQFDTFILNQIASRPNFVLVLSHGSLKRCLQPDDWLLREIRHAVRLRRSIIPVWDAGFKWEDESNYLPSDIAAELGRRNAISFHDTYYDAFIGQIERFIRNPQQQTEVVITPAPEAEAARAQQSIREALRVRFEDSTVIELIGKFHKLKQSASSSSDWENLLHLWSHIRSSGSLPSYFQLDQEELNLRSALIACQKKEAEERERLARQKAVEKDYDLLRQMAQHPDIPAEFLQEKLIAFWDAYPEMKGYDPDSLSRRNAKRPPTDPPTQSVSSPIQKPVSNASTPKNQPSNFFDDLDTLRTSPTVVENDIPGFLRPDTAQQTKAKTPPQLSENKTPNRSGASARLLNAYKSTQDKPPSRAGKSDPFDFDEDLFGDHDDFGHGEFGFDDEVYPAERPTRRRRKRKTTPRSEKDTGAPTPSLINPLDWLHTIYWYMTAGLPEINIASSLRVYSASLRSMLVFTSVLAPFLPVLMISLGAITGTLEWRSSFMTQSSAGLHNLTYLWLLSPLLFLCMAGIEYYSVSSTIKFHPLVEVALIMVMTVLPAIGVFGLVLAVDVTLLSVALMGCVAALGLQLYATFSDSKGAFTLLSFTIFGLIVSIIPGLTSATGAILFVELLGAVSPHLVPMLGYAWLPYVVISAVGLILVCVTLTALIGFLLYVSSDRLEETIAAGGKKGTFMRLLISVGILAAYAATAAEVFMF